MFHNIKFIPIKNGSAKKLAFDHFFFVFFVFFVIMKRYYSSVETQSSTKGKQKQSESPGEASSSEKPDSSKPSKAKRCKNRSKPDPKWMENGNDAWL